METRSFRIIYGTTLLLVIAGGIVFGSRTLQLQTASPERFGFGKPLNKVEIAQWDVDVRPDGKGLPAGEGGVMEGKLIYAAKCAACHAADGREIKGVKLPGPPLVGDTAAKSKPKTIGNYWPYATTLFDYIRRTMPYNAPGSLSDAEVYSLTAYLLHANKIISQGAVMNAQRLPLVVMPAQKLFVKDIRHGGNEVK